MSDVIRMKLQDVVNMGGGSGSDEIWLPSVDAEGDLSWSKSSSSTPPETVNIKGPAGADGSNGQDGQDGANGLGVKSLAVDASNHLITTFDNDTTEDAGEINVTVPIDDTTAANNKVYSSEKVENIASGKFDASYAEISGGGANLFDIDNSKPNFKPNTTAGTSTYSDGTTESYFTTNLIPAKNLDKFKFKCDNFPFSYLRVFLYDENQVYIAPVATYTIDEDGYPYFEILANNNVRYFCMVLGWNPNSSYYTSLVISKYADFGPEKLVFDELYFNDNNVAMAKNRLGIVDDILYGKKWAVAGDSFTAGDFSGTTAPTIPDGKYAGQKAVYPYLIGNRCNMVIQNLSNGGRTLALPSGETSSYNSFTNVYQTVAADADYLTMYFGINDSHQSATIPLGAITDNTTDSFYGAWNVILTWLITNRPNLHIGIIVSNGCDSDDYRTATIAIANKYGIPYIDMNGDKQTPCMIRSTNATIDASIRNQRTSAWRVSENNGHPNADCHAFEATFIENFLRTL